MHNESQNSWIVSAMHTKKCKRDTPPMSPPDVVFIVWWTSVSAQRSWINVNKFTNKCLTKQKRITEMETSKELKREKSVGGSRWTKRLAMFAHLLVRYALHCMHRTLGREIITWISLWMWWSLHFIQKVMIFNCKFAWQIFYIKYWRSSSGSRLLAF